MDSVRLRGKFAVENNRLKQKIHCLLRTAPLRLKAAYVPACARYCLHSTNFPVWATNVVSFGVLKMGLFLSYQNIPKFSYHKD